MELKDDGGRVDDLRKQLRALGYLDAGVDRFVLGPARSARSPTTIAALSSLRVGLIAAALLGPSAAIGVGTRFPGLVTGPRDAALVALYLGAIFGTAMAALTFAASLLFARLSSRDASRARLRSRTAGAIVTVCVLTYLTLWWRSASAGVAWATPMWTALALVLAVVISLLLGHAVAVTTFALMAARQKVSDAAVLSGTRTWRLVFGAGLLAFCGAAALLFVATPVSGGAAYRPPLPIVSAGLRVKLLAIDGFDPQVFERLNASGRVPELARLVGGARARLAMNARDPARTWTTVATGQPPDVHGVLGLETRRVAGLRGTVAAGDEGALQRTIRGATDLLRLTRPSLASGTELRSKPFWEVASEAGLRAAVVNWWATWPAGGADGPQPVVVSDRAALRLERGGSLDAEISPGELYDLLRAEWSSITREAAEVVKSSLPLTGDPQLDGALRRSAELDALQLALSARVSENDPDLLAVYLPGLDIAQHTLLASGAAPSAIASRLDALAGYYAYIDALLRWRKPAGEIIVVVTGPGRLSSTAQGTMSISGAIAGRGIDVTANVVDVAPTILHLLGVPVSRELAGKPLLGLLTPEFTARFPVREVPTYGRRSGQTTIRRGDPLDREAIERLRSLGYVR